MKNHTGDFQAVAIDVGSFGQIVTLDYMHLELAVRGNSERDLKAGPRLSDIGATIAFTIYKTSFMHERISGTPRHSYVHPSVSAFEVSLDVL